MSLESQLIAQYARNASQHALFNKIVFNAIVIFMLVNAVVLCILLTIRMRFREDGASEPAGDL